MYHYRKTRNNYKKLNASDRQQADCTFCRTLKQKAGIVYDGSTMFILSNRVSYDLFEGRAVTDHLMVIPKRHTESLADFTDEEALEMHRLSGEYELKGYNIYARSSDSVTRSVRHQHTHFIKTDNKVNKLFLYIRRPHFLIKL